jgi:hypothetical protein
MAMEQFKKLLFKMDANRHRVPSRRVHHGVSAVIFIPFLSLHQLHDSINRLVINWVTFDSR